MRRLNIGRGGKASGNWLNVDIDPALEPDVVDDVRVMAKFKNRSIDEIFASHLLEHIDEKDVIPTLKLWRKKLKIGGKLSIFCPDIERAWREYFGNKIDDNTLLVAMIGQEPSRSPYQRHRTMLWYSRVEKLLKAVGFKKCRELPCRGKRYEFGIQVIK